MKFNLKFLMIIFAITQFQNSVYSAEMLKTAANFVKEIPSKILANKKLQRDILRAAVIVIPTFYIIGLHKKINDLENSRYNHRWSDPFHPNCDCATIPGGLGHYM